MLGISLYRPVLLSRTIAWMLAPLCVALGDVLTRRPRPVAIAAVVLLAAAQALQLTQLDGLREEWRGFLARLPGLSPPALVVLAPHTPPAEFAAAVTAGRPVWLIDRRPDYGWMRSVTGDLPAPRLAIQSAPGDNPAMRALSL